MIASDSSTIKSTFYKKIWLMGGAAMAGRLAIGMIFFILKFLNFTILVSPELASGLLGSLKEWTISTSFIG